MVYTYEHQVQYYETDQMGAVHHSNHIRWFEECRGDMMEHAGKGYRWMEEEGIFCPVTSVTCHYRSMARYGETMQVQAVVEKYTGIRLTLSYRVIDKSSGEVRCTGESKHCFLNEKGQPINLRKVSPEFSDMFEAYKEAK